MTKFKLSEETVKYGGVTLYRIVCTASFDSIEKGDKGGYIEKVTNLSQDGNAWVYNNAMVYGCSIIKYGAWSKFDNNLDNIKSSLNIVPINGIYTFYKKVDKISKNTYRSLHDSKFTYTMKEIAKLDLTKKEIKNLDPNESCGPGLHVSTPTYWSEGDTLLAVSVDSKDIISVVDCKVRCSKLLVIGEVK